MRHIEREKIKCKWGYESLEIKQPSLKLFACCVVSFIQHVLLKKHYCWVYSGPAQGLFQRLVFWGNQRHGKGETALLSDITSSLFWSPKWPLNKGSLSLTLPCSMLSLRGTDGVMGGLSTWTSDTITEWHSTVQLQQWHWLEIKINDVKTQLMIHFWLVMSITSKLMKGPWLVT